MSKRALHLGTISIAEERAFWTKEAQFQSIPLRREYVVITATLSSAILLSQLVYWFRPTKNGKPKLTVFREGRYWLAKTKDEWHRECGLTPRGYRTAIAELTKSGVVETRLWKFGGRPVTHYWLDVERLDALIQFHDPGFVAEDPNIVEWAQSTLSLRHDQPCHFVTVNCDGTSHSYNTINTTMITAMTTDTVQQAARGTQGVQGVQEIQGNIEGDQGMTKVVGAVKFAGKTAADVLAKAKSRSVAAQGDTLIIRWKKEYSGVYGGFFGTPTAADVGKLGRIGKAVGLEKALEIISWAVRDWQRYAARVRDQKGLARVPERPVIGFLLMHYDVALEAMEEKASDSAVSTPSPLPKWQGQEQTGGSVQLIAKPKKQVAGADDVDAAMKQLGLG